MGLVSMHRRGLMLVAAAVAMALAIFLITAPVPAATRMNQVAAQHLSPASHLTSFRIPVKRKPGALVGNAICLTKASTHCSAFDASTIYTAVLSTINTAIIIYTVIHNKKTGSNEDKSEGDEGGNTKTSNLCLGVTSSGADVKYMSCSAKHGVWWNWNSYKSGYRVWNTYVKQYLTVTKDNNGADLYVSPIKSGTWQNWTVEFCDGC